jgi:hypothetical protein
MTEIQILLVKFAMRQVEQSKENLLDAWRHLQHVPGFTAEQRRLEKICSAAADEWMRLNQTLHAQRTGELNADQT